MYGYYYILFSNTFLDTKSYPTLWNPASKTWVNVCWSYWRWKNNNLWNSQRCPYIATQRWSSTLFLSTCSYLRAQSKGRHEILIRVNSTIYNPETEKSSRLVITCACSCSGAVIMFGVHNKLDNSCLFNNPWVTLRYFRTQLIKKTVSLSYL